MASTSFQVAGLASGFDWKTFVDQIMEVERAPAQRIAAERTTNNQKISLLGTLGTRLSALQDAVEALRTDDVFGQRTATSSTSGSGWTLSAGGDTPIGTYRIAVTRLATTASLAGGTGVAAPLAATPAGVADLTLATLPVAQAVTAGSFSVNGQKVTVALTDSLQDVFDAIATATSGDVSASYDPAADKITLSSGSGSLLLGAANDTSNYLSALKLGNNGTGSVTSTGRLGAISTTAALASGNLAAAIGADANGDGTFKINGVSISYNVNDDTLSAVLQRINDSDTGVTASYDRLNDRVVLTNTVTGDLGISAADTGGGLLAALGLASGTTFTRGDDAEFTVNGGAALNSSSNTLTAAAHGITGLSLTVDTEETQTISVAADTAAMRTKIESFIRAFNEVQQFVETNTKVTTDAKGKVTAAALATNREIQDWARSLRSLAFGAVSGLGGSIDQLDDLGLDFKRGTNELEIADSSKLNTALADSADDVAEYFETSSTGFSAQMEDFLDRIAAQNEDQTERLSANDSRLAEQIAAIERRLEQQRALMESAFLQMERAQSTIKQQQAAIDSIFAAKK